jgi:hypothetical protein
MIEEFFSIIVTKILKKMQKLILLFIASLFIISCQKEKQEKSFMLIGNIKGLKKGTLYIQRIKDTLLVPIDTIDINGNSQFSSQFDLQEPEMLYLFLDRGVTNSLDNNISFFAEKGKMNIETSLDYFTEDVKITGSKNQELYDEYKKVATRFVDQNLDLIQKRFKALKEKNADEVTKIKEQEGNNIKRKYLYTTNFAVSHSDYEVSPYVALAEIYDINIKFLDTIQKSMTPKVAKSFYGKKLIEYYNERKKLGK